jgi:hypothetical protein
MVTRKLSTSRRWRSGNTPFAAPELVLNNLVLTGGCRTGYIYPKASTESKKKNREIAKIVNAERQEQARKRIALATVPGSTGSQQVISVNAQIDQRNEDVTGKART